jgi:DNA-binding MarR family transcriptional regulator
MALDWEQIAEGLVHPTRMAVLREIDRMEEASPRRLADVLDESISNIAYHVRALHRAQLLREARTAPRRGAVEHFYRLTPRAKRQVRRR